MDSTILKQLLSNIMIYFTETFTAALMYDNIK